VALVVALVLVLVPVVVLALKGGFEAAGQVDCSAMFFAGNSGPCASFGLESSAHVLHCSMFYLRSTVLLEMVGCLREAVLAALLAVVWPLGPAPAEVLGQQQVFVMAAALSSLPFPYQPKQGTCQDSCAEMMCGQGRDIFVAPA
jgi:hypothetical protein